MKSLCVIPARGGSKRIPGKNIRKFCGKPIIIYSIEAAIGSKLFDEVMVSTDDHQIAEIARVNGASVPFFRSRKNANDYAGLADVLIEVIEQYKRNAIFFDSICCILPTAPFVTPTKLINAEEMFKNGKYNCIFPVVEYNYPIQRSLKIEDEYIKMRWPENLSKRSQDLESTYHDSGQFYFINVETLLIEKKLFTEFSGCLVADKLEVQDIDTVSDWKIAEMKYKLFDKG